MALASAGISRVCFSNNSSSSEFNGSKWASNNYSLLYPPDASRIFTINSNASPKIIACSAVQESSTPTVSAEKKEAKPEKEEESGPAKPKPPPAKALPEMMEEDIIPSLKAILEAEDDIIELKLSFQDNRLEGSFLKNDIPYSFWAFFPDGALTGSRGFSLSSYGSEVSTVEPFLIDEKKITAKHVVFWVEKRLAAQGIIPVWKE